jgi:hypothetical protein
MLILIVTGTPWSLPSAAPLDFARSAARASEIACSLRSMTTALSAGFTACIRSTWASITSSDVITPSLIAVAVWTADHCQTGVCIAQFLLNWMKLTRNAGW